MKKNHKHDTYMQNAQKVGNCSNCLRSERKVGAVAVRDGKIILSAPNGTSDNVTPCGQRGNMCIRKQLGIKTGTQLEVCWCLHAEQRLVCMAARDGISLKDTTVYCTHRPCLICTKLLSESGVKEVFCLQNYPNEMAEKYAEEVGLKIKFLT